MILQFLLQPKQVEHLAAQQMGNYPCWLVMLINEIYV